MKKRIIVSLIVLISISVCLCVWLNRVNYEVYDNISNAEINPLDGVNFKVDADRKTGNLQIENCSDQYIVIDFSRKPIVIEIQKEDGWHRLNSNNIVQAEPCAIPEGTTYSLDFDWRNFIDGPLKAGNYRAILRFGDGIIDLYDAYSIVTEFCVD